MSALLFLLLAVALVVAVTRSPVPLPNGVRPGLLGLALYAIVLSIWHRWLVP